MRAKDCPLCASTMAQVTGSEVTLDRCPRQHGTWFDGGELRAFAKTHGKHRLYETDARRRVELGSNPPRECPACRDRTLQGGMVEGLAIYVCDTCEGFFLPMATSNRLRVLSRARPGSASGSAVHSLLDLANLIQPRYVQIGWIRRVLGALLSVIFLGSAVLASWSAVTGQEWLAGLAAIFFGVLGLGAGFAAVTGRSPEHLKDFVMGWPWIG